MLVVDPGYGYVKAGKDIKNIVMYPSGIQVYTHFDEALSVLKRMKNTTGIKYGDVFYIVGEKTADTVNKNRWKNTEEIGMLVASAFGSMNVVSKETEEELVVLAPIFATENIVSLEKEIRITEFLQNVEVFGEDGVLHKLPTVKRVVYYPQPYGTVRYFYKVLQEKDRWGAVVIDIGYGTLDVMSFLTLEGEITPEWDRKIISEYDTITGHKLEEMLIEQTGYDAKMIRLLASRGKIQFNDKNKRLIKNHLLSLLSHYETLADMYAIIITGGGGALLSATYPELTKDLGNMWNMVILGNSRTLNVQGMFVKI